MEKLKFDSTHNKNSNQEAEKGVGEQLNDDYVYSVTTTDSLFVTRKTHQMLENLNKKFSVLSKDGRIPIMDWQTTESSDDKELRMDMRVSDFKLRFKNKLHKVKYWNNRGEEKMKSMDIGSLWEIWQHRRQYDGIDFHPYEDRKEYESDEEIWDLWDDWATADESNDWRGDVQKRGLNKFMNLETLNILSTDRQYEDSLQGCRLYLEHIDRIICGNYTGQKHEDLRNYVIAWMSRCLTHHGRDRVKVALVLQGRQGCGKGTMVDQFGQLFGRHYLAILRRGQLTDHFNFHLMNKLLVYINEALFAGNKEIMNQLKGLLTEDTIQIEEKYMNSFTGKSYMRFIYSSNEDWVVPIEWDDRRYMVIDVSDEMTGNKDSQAYFDAFHKEWGAGGKEHLYKFLTSDKIMGQAREIHFEHDRVKTVASTGQLVQTDEVVGWLHKIFTDGGHRIFENGEQIQKWHSTDDDENAFICQYLYEDFNKYCKDEGRRRSGSRNTLGTRLNDLAKKGKIIFETKRCSPTFSREKFNRADISSYWAFGSLDKLRDAWVKEIWGGDEIGAWGEADVDDSDDKKSE